MPPEERLRTELVGSYKEMVKREGLIAVHVYLREGHREGRAGMLMKADSDRMTGNGNRL